METKNLTIMFVDVAGYTLKTANTSRVKFISLLDMYESLIEPIFPEFNGSIIKKIGDAFMAVFESPTNAVLCGIKIQNTLFQYNKQVHYNDIIKVKVAINSGEVHIRGNDIYGDAVNVAAKLEDVTPVDKIYFTNSVYLSMNKAEIQHLFIGARKLKNVRRPVKIYKVLGKKTKMLIKKKMIRKRKLENIRLLLFASLIIFLAAFLVVAIYFLGFGNLF